MTVDAYAHIQRLVSLVKWRPCLSVQAEGSVVFCIFCGQRDSMPRGLIKKCLLVTVGSVCRLKNGSQLGLETWQTFCWWRRGWNGGAEVAETTIKRLLCYGFRRSGKVMGRVYQCWWRICQKINVFSRFRYHVLHPFVAYLPTLPRMYYIEKLRSDCHNYHFWSTRQESRISLLPHTFPRMNSCEHNTEYA
jgi:hypothetical protein